MAKSATYAFALLMCGLGLAAGAEQPTPLNYDRDVRPILSENCFLCHGQDSKKRMAGLRLDSFEGATADRKGKVAFAPGKPEESLAYQRMLAVPARRMPPISSNRSLTAEQIAILKHWIEEGAQYAKHWAFVPPQRPAVPRIASATWVKNPIDAFVGQRLQAEGLHPNPVAAPEVWLRRVYLDLTGLPPSPAELDRFMVDAKKRGEAAYAGAVDRLLASPAYGERMTMDWLDVARYADTHGFNNDAERSMWRWRDWVIDSFNRNMPYNQFITEQLAGDLLPDATLDQRIATGFGRNHVINSEGGIIEEEYRVEYVADRVRTLGMAWMGITLECAHCHDHKFDPITQKDHYRFAAFFNNLAELGEDGRVANAAPFIAAPTGEQQKRMAALEAAIERVSKKKVIVALQPPANEQVLCATCLSNNELSKPVPISKRDPVTFSAWIKPAAQDKDAALISALDYSQNTAAASYGSGIELRLAGGELEFRFSQRFPGYSIQVRSEGARILPGEWRHVALVYQGVKDKNDMRARAAWVRIFINGAEVPTNALNDDLPLPDAEGNKAVPTKFRMGWDNGPGSARFGGELAEVSAWNSALQTDEVSGLFASRAAAYGADAKQDSEELRKLRAEWLALRRELPTVMVMQERAVPRETHILIRGSYDAPGEKVESGVPEELLGAWPAGAPRNRLGLAQWLTKPDHPLTSRVVVNRFWQQLFGEGLVKTSDNFGMQGEWPSHPELLDWLAREFVDSGWNVKRLMKLMVLSATYRQDSSGAPELFARDPENRLLARGPRFRLPAEVIRDQALQISGLLKPRVGGPGVFPYQPVDLYKGVVVAANYPGTKWVESQGDDLYRRSMYTFWKRTVPHPAMNVFDAPDREVCTVRRSVTNTPLQALTLLNDPIFVEAARKLAERAIHEGGVTAAIRLGLAFRLATGRNADQRELGILQASLEKMLAAYRADRRGAEALLGVGASKPDATIPPVELAAYTAVANIILNMDETITKS